MNLIQSLDHFQDTLSAFSVIDLAFLSLLATIMPWVF